jgi:N-acetylglucosaminyldiphosphoundecaprenol N-acetyl-beta-D-mannosaminyltransferase
LLDQGRIRPFRVYLLGSKPGVTERAADNIAYRFKGVEVIGYHHGYFSAQEKDHLIQDIKMLRPHLLLVGLGVPLQEIFLYENLNQMHVPVGIGIGGTIDVLSGMVKRAPLPIRRLGLEWAYRIVKQPRRFKRGLAIPRFIWAVCRETLTRQTTGQ